MSELRDFYAAREAVQTFTEIESALLGGGKAIGAAFSAARLIWARATAEAVSVSPRIVLTSEEVMERAISTGAEKIAGFTIDGSKTLTGATLQRDVFFIGADAGKGSSIC
jgi:hypothetical protein